MICHPTQVVLDGKKIVINAICYNCTRQKRRCRKVYEKYIGDFILLKGDLEEALLSAVGLSY